MSHLNNIQAPFIDFCKIIFFHSQYLYVYIIVLYAASTTNKNHGEEKICINTLLFLMSKNPKKGLEGKDLLKHMK